MTDQHPITPPPELVQHWINHLNGDTWRRTRTHTPNDVLLAACAAEWGAEQELDACCEWLRQFKPQGDVLSAQLFHHRRPKPQSLAEGPTDEEVDAWVDQQGFIRGHGDHPCGFWIDDGDAGALVRAALARWGK